jgi:aspartate aminotransferase
MRPGEPESLVFEPSAAVERITATSLRPTFAPVPGLISLAMGEPDFDTPPEIIAAAIDALHAGYTRYTEPSGDAELRDALAALVSKTARAPYGRDQVLVTHGSSAGLAAAILAIVSPGDRVVIPEPSYSLYADLVNLAGGVSVLVPLLPDFHLDFAALASALDGARLVVLCTPGNPTGAVYRADEWARLGALIAAGRAYVLSDEAYHALVYDGAAFVSGLTIGALRERLVYAQTFSKTYAMTGWRIGYVAGPAPIVKAAGVIHRAFNATNNAFVQRAALAALRDDGRSARGWLEQFSARRDFALDGLRKIDGLTVATPEGSFYIFARYAAPISSEKLAERMIEGGVSVRAGREYGPSGEGFFRLSFATSTEKLAIGIERIASVFAKLLAAVEAGLETVACASESERS